MRRPGQLFLVDVVGRDSELAGVVQQVVEQDLRRQHRKELQERGATAALNMLPKLRRRAHQHVLDRVGEDSPALDDAVGEHAEVVLEEQDVGGVFGDVGGGVDGDPDIGMVQRQRVVDSVAQERDGLPAARWTRMIRAFCSGVTRAKMVVARSRPASSASSRASMSVPVSVPPTPCRGPADTFGDDGVVAGDDLDRDTEIGEARQRPSGRSLRRVEEDEEAGEVEVVFVRRR